MTNIKELIEKAKDFPNSTIEYSCELPKGLNTKGVKMVFNKDVPAATGAVLTYKY